MKLKSVLVTALLAIGASSAQASDTELPSILASVSSKSMEKLSDVDAAKTRGEYVTCRWIGYRGHRGARSSGRARASKGRASSRGRRGRASPGALPSRSTIVRAIERVGARGARGAVGASVRINSRHGGGYYSCRKTATFHRLRTGKVGYGAFRWLAGSKRIAGWRVYVSR